MTRGEGMRNACSYPPPNYATAMMTDGVAYFILW